MQLENKHIKAEDREIMSQVFYDFLCETFDPPTIDGILEFLKVDKSELYQKEIQSRMLHLLKSSYGSL